MRKSRRVNMRKTRKGGRRSMRMCSRNNFMQGGNLGMSYRNGDMIIPGVVANERIPSCGAVARPGMLGGVTATGLPMSGGKRNRRRHRRSMKGGRYGIDLAGAADIPMGTQGGLAPIARMGCELGASPTKSTAPMIGGALYAPYPQAMEMKTAGYENKPSDFVTATGSPIMLQVPVGGRSGPSCAMQGGRRSRKQRSRKQRSRKQRSRKQRKASRRQRKH
jgi:hypothetical protein